MEVHYNKYCQKCTGKVVMHAFSEGECTLCNATISTSHTPCDKVCDKCSDEKGVCMSCGESLNEVKRTIKYFRGAEKTPDNIESITTEMELTASEILDQYKDYLNPTQKELLTGYMERSFTSASDDWVEQMQNYIKQVNEEKQHLEGLVLTWRAKLKDGCQERADSLRQTSEWHEHDDEEFAIIKDACFTPLRDFDKHFSITEQRQGHV